MDDESASESLPPSVSSWTNQHGVANANLMLVSQAAAALSEISLPSSCQPMSDGSLKLPSMLASHNDCESDASLPSVSESDKGTSDCMDANASDQELINAFDAEDEIIDLDEEHANFTELQLHRGGQPSVTPPPPGTHLVSQLSAQDVAEYYSPPRIVPLAKRIGAKGNAMLSLDILTGWDFRHDNVRKLSLDLLTSLPVQFVMLCPPCAIFSALQRLWDIKKMSKDVFNSKWEEGVLHVSHAMACAKCQLLHNRFFAYEHPAGASSWSLPDVQEVQSMSGVYTVVVDMCMMGLVSKVDQQPMRKRTRIMTNCGALVRSLQGKLCDKTHDHQTIQGSEGGVRRSSWAQIYPQPFAALVAEAACSPF